jgi:hypothetical protein
VGLPAAQPPSWITEPADLAQILREADFGEVEVTIEAHTSRYADLDQYWARARTTGRRVALDALDAAERRLE